MNSKTTIEVNGKRYDAITGAVIGPATTPVATHGHNIDGFFRSREGHAKHKIVEIEEAKTDRNSQKVTVATPAPAAPKPHRQPQRATNHARGHTPQKSVTTTSRSDASVSPQVHHASHHNSTAVNHAKHRVPQSSVTLMRTAVKRPDPSLRAQLKPSTALQHSVPSLITAKQSVQSVDATRLARAHEVQRSPHVGHISVARPNLFATVAPLPVQPAPTPTPTNDPPADAPSPAPTNKPATTPTDIFEHALMNATHFVDVHAHSKHFKKQVRRHMTSMAAGTLALLVIAGFAAYQNTPGIQFKVASIRAGVATSMPNFKAAGFAYNGARAQNGKLTVGFSNGQNKYQLIQQTTNLTGEEVIQNIGTTTVSGHPTYHAVHSDDVTIYRFSNTDATWVENGMWYTVQGTAVLTDAQVTALARNV